MPYPSLSHLRQHPAGWRRMVLIPVLLTLLSLSGCKRETPAITSRFNAFGTQVDLSLVAVKPDQAERASVALKRDFELMHKAWHAWKPGPMGRINQMLPTGEPFVAPPSVMPLIRLSQTYSEQSGGLFNPAIGHLIDLWGFHGNNPKHRAVPAEQSIARLVKADPRMSDVHIEGLELRGTNPAVKLDFNGIAKGYAIDLAIGHLRDLGVRHAMVQIGTDLRVIGDRSGQPWRVPVRRASGSGVLGVLQLSGDESLATSAAYDRNFIYAGVTYHHILDPRTGWPAKGTQSVTVIHKDSTSADAAATALFVAGPDQWEQVARDMGVGYVLLVDSQGTVHMNPAMRDRIELVDENLDLVVSEPLTPASKPPDGSSPNTGDTDR